MASAAGVQEKIQTGEVLEADAPMEEQIRIRAYEIWLQRGGGHGWDIDDWLQAEEEILPREALGLTLEG